MAAISGGILVAAILTGVLTGDRGVLANGIIVSTLAIFFMYFIYQYQKYRDIKEMEAVFPNFLHDLAEAISSGMPLYKAIQQTSKIGYGRLSLELKKMSNQISWGMSVDKVLSQFAERIKSSKRLYMAVNIIREAHLSGGDIVSVIDSVADSLISLQDAEKEKRSILHQHMLIIYAITIIFIVIIVLINRLLMPIFSSPAFGQQVGLTNPCDTCTAGACSICALFELTSTSLFGVKPGIASYYTSLFFYMAFIQAFFAGLVAGQISENSVMGGLKHSLILSVIVLVSFMFLSRLGLLGV
jgi:flagellar protein FlaJ